MDPAVLGQLITGFVAITVAIIGLQTARAAAVRSVKTEEKMDTVVKQTDGLTTEVKSLRESKGYAEGMAEERARSQAVLDRMAEVAALQKAAADAATLAVLQQPTAPQVAASANDAARVLTDKVANGAAVAQAAHDAATPADLITEGIAATKDATASAVTATQAADDLAGKLGPPDPPAR